MTVVYVVNLLGNPAYGKIQVLYINANGIHTDLEMFIFLFAGLCVHVMARVFKRAVEVKQENDYTV